MSVLGEYLYKMIEACPLWTANTTVIAACSGGADSLALTAALQHLALDCNSKVQVVHVQHHLRGAEAERDAKLVQNFCAERHLAFTQKDVDVQALVEAQGLSVEEAARKLRYQALEECRQAKGATAIFLAQHRDDQAETVLLNLLRGAGTKGIRGMLALNGYLARPFLQVTKEELLEYCQQEKINYAVDSTNEDTKFTRNWVRKKVLPVLEEKNPNIKKQLAQAATLAAWDEEYLQGEADKYLRAYGTDLGGFYDVEVGDAFNNLAPAIKTRVLRTMLQGAGAVEVSFEHTRDLAELIGKGVGNKAFDVPGKVRAIYLNGRLTVGKNANSRAEERAAKNLQKECQRNACKS